MVDRARTGQRATLSLFAATLLLSAFLLFSVQPFFAKMVLPLLGGSPAVWSVAMVFFQATLLAGYAYAHLLTSRLSTRLALAVHMVVTALAFAVLPIAIPDGWNDPPASGQAPWQLGLFAVAVGLPFFAVSANAPLLQAWFARTGHSHASDPYFLYGASNLGSVASLALFIVFFEPLFAAAQQSTMWTGGYGLLAIMILACGAVVLVQTGEGTIGAAPPVPPQKEGFMQGPLRWALYAFVPSGLLVAVTAHISLDIAAAPLLWVVPLALFLLTFVLAFARRPPVPLELLSKQLPGAAALALVVMFSPWSMPVWIDLGVHLGFFFFAALFCHSLLVRARPAAFDLTRFYFWISAGGVAGGIFAALLAPALFDWLAEYVLLIILVVLLRPQLTSRPSGEIAALALVAAASAVALVAVAGLELVDILGNRRDLALAIAVLAVAGLPLLFLSPIAHALTVVLVAPMALLHAEAGGNLFLERSFHGVVRVSETQDGRYRLLHHGTTLHGAQDTRTPFLAAPDSAPEPLTYYHRSGGMARAIFAMQRRRGGAMDHVGAIGLGTGSAVCHRAPGERWTAYEIDPGVVRAALDPDLFSFMSACGPDVPILIGDARLRLAEEPDASYDLLLVDAFSSDSIPVHLMTREAVRLYMDKLVDDGLLVMHISNRYLELESVVAAIAEEKGLAIRAGLFWPEGADADHPYINATRVAVLANEEADFGALLEDERWQVPRAGDTRGWTDDYSDVFSALLRGA